MFFIVGLVLLLVLPDPWDLAGFALCLGFGVVELFFWQRSVRGYRRAVGPETLVGREAVVISSCRPVGQVRIDGEIWSAQCDDGASPGEAVRVLGRRRLRLLVKRVD
jgi:membrane protein implicated in regulation of membrane protease activity